MNADMLRALRALRDCRVIRANALRGAFADLDRTGYARGYPIAGPLGYGKRDYRLTAAGADFVRRLPPMRQDWGSVAYG